jgi:uncharacterized membrane protein
MTLRRALVGLVIVGIGIAGYLTYVHYAGIKPICTAGGGCEKVQSSEWSKLGGVPVALIGLVGYVGIYATLLVRGELPALARVGLTTVGLGFSAYLTYRELFSIDAICQWCVASAVVMTLLFLGSVADYLRGPSDRYSSLADTPVSSDTTDAAGRGRAPASTRRRRAPSA